MVEDAGEIPQRLQSGIVLGPSFGLCSQLHDLPIRVSNLLRVSFSLTGYCLDEQDSVSVHLGR